ncbi:MAG: polysaccharide pyruvyl transferase family protein [Xanthomonadales bacterium]|nr:polysaccharide pyruvyl transferase family protein [Xanthomonadales bacterium]
MKAPRRLQACFTGYYGMNNFGDDLFGLICSRAASQYWDADARLAGPAIPGVDARYTMPGWYPTSLYGSRGKAGQASRLLSFVHALYRADVLVLGGGSIVNSRESFRRPLMLEVRRRRGVDLAAVGISIGPFADTVAQTSAAGFLRHFAYVSVRDRRSYELALAMGLGDRVRYGRDLAGLLPLLAESGFGIRRMRDAAAPVRIGVAPCNYRADTDYHAPDPDTLVPTLCAALRRVAVGRSIEVAVYSLNEHDLHGDRALSRQLQQCLDHAGIACRLMGYAGQGPLMMAGSIGTCDAFVSARLHGAITAYMGKVPFTIIDYHPKCGDFADDIGLADVRRLVRGRDDVDSTVAAIEAMLDGTGAPLLSPGDYAAQAAGIFRHAPWWKPCGAAA